jgi:glyoxylase-like metal-dependent hydrolase (beta-lactamase superfamily II)
VTYLPDGIGVLDRSVAFPTSKPADWSQHADCLDADDKLLMSYGAFLIRTGTRHILVDLGMGPVDLEIPGLGRVRGGELPASLAQEGLGPQDIDTVVFTHLHPDHVGWTTGGAASHNPAAVAPQLTFGNARHHVAAAEWSYWHEGGHPAAPDPVTVLEPLAEQIALVEDGDQIAPGVHVRATPGHTPGHLCVVVTDPAASSTERIVITGDLLHCAAQVAREDWRFFADVDSERAHTTRTAMLAELDDPAVTVAAGHFAGHVFGRIASTTHGRDWMPRDQSTPVASSSAAGSAQPTAKSLPVAGAPIPASRSR